MNAHRLKVVPDLIENPEEESNISEAVTTEVATAFVTECQKAISEIASKHGLTLQQYEIGKTAFDVSVNLLVAPLNTINFDLHMQNYIAHGNQFGLKPEWIQRTITGTKQGKRFEAKISGLVIQTGKAQVRLSTNEGTKYISPSKLVEMMSAINKKLPTSTLAVQLAHADMNRKSLVQKLFKNKELPSSEK